MKSRRFQLFAIFFAAIFVLFPSRSEAVPRSNTYTVNSDTDVSDADPGNGFCATSGGNCTLRAAIQEANLDGVPSTILFATRFTGANTISPATNLPTLTEDNTTIDASNQFNHLDDRPGVELASSSVDQLLHITSDDNIIRGIYFGGTPIGIKVAGNNNIIGGSEAGQRNVFQNPESGVYLYSGEYHSVMSNYFGTIDGETVNVAGSGDNGIYVEYSHHNTISDNLIVGYRGIDSSIFPPAGIVIYYAHNNQVSNNIIGMDKWKITELGNNIGIYLYHANDTDIGSSNFIAGNKSHGIHAVTTEGLSIFDNELGCYTSGAHGNGGHGIFLEFMGNGTSIFNNIIRENSESGIWGTVEYATIQDNNIYSNNGHGIHLSGSHNLIGGLDQYESNSLFSNDGNGIYLDSGDYNTISGNYVYGNQFGILLENNSNNNTIGGTTVGERNWIFENILDGIRVQGTTTHSNLVIGNVIGIDTTWTNPVGNSHHGIGVYDGAHNNQIGTIGDGNYVFDSGWSGIVVVNSPENIVEGNLIGTDGVGGSWGNGYFGVNIVGSGNDNQVNRNEIAFNGLVNGIDDSQAGIKIDDSTGNMVSRNSIHDNDGPGIQLVNDGNKNMQAPIIDLASCKGPIEGTAQAFSWIQIFSDASDEGRFWEGTTQVNASGSWSWNGLVRGPNVTATARDHITNDTSPFSGIFPVGNCMFDLYLPMIIR